MNELDKTIHDLWHISRTALATDPYGHTRGTRFAYVMRELKTREEYKPLIEGFGGSNKKLMFYVEEQLAPTHVI